VPIGLIKTILSIASALFLAGCAGFANEVPTLEPISVPGVTSPQARQKIVSGRIPVPEASGVALSVDPSLFGGVGNAVDVTIASRRGFASIPGVALDWNDLKDIPADHRAEFIGSVDLTLRQLQTAMLNAKMELAKPGLEAARTETLGKLEAAVADLTRRRSELELVQPERWEFAKEEFHESWLDTESAFVRAGATSP